VNPLMRRRKFLTKWALPYTLTTLVFLWQWHGESAKPNPRHLAALFACVTLYVFLFFVIRRQSAEEPDEMLDGGTFLQVTYGDRTETVQLSDVAKVEIQKILRTTRVILHLRVPVIAGDTISFYPIQKRDSSGQNVVAAALLARTNGSNAGISA
jgi:hypothetical protein